MWKQLCFESPGIARSRAVAIGSMHIWRGEGQRSLWKQQGKGWDGLVMKNMRLIPSSRPLLHSETNQLARQNRNRKKKKKKKKKRSSCFENRAKTSKTTTKKNEKPCQKQGPSACILLGSRHEFRFLYVGFLRLLAASAARAVDFSSGLDKDVYSQRKGLSMLWL